MDILPYKYSAFASNNIDPTGPIDVMKIMLVIYTVTVVCQNFKKQKSIFLFSNITDNFIDLIFPLFGLPFFFIGFYNAFGHIPWDSYLRSKTHYTLTSKRAFIATAHPTKGKLLVDHMIDEDTHLALRIGPPDSVFFKNAKYGFKRIEDGRKVHKLMRQIQENSQ